jgi:hypothetical protein
MSASSKIMKRMKKDKESESIIPVLSTENSVRSWMEELIVKTSLQI